MMLFGTLTQTRHYHTHRVLKNQALKKVIKMKRLPLYLVSLDVELMKGILCNFGPIFIIFYGLAAIRCGT